MPTSVLALKVSIVLICWPVYSRARVHPAYGALCFSSVANSCSIILASTLSGKRPARLVFVPCAHLTVSIPLYLPYKPVRMRPSNSIDTSFQASESGGGGRSAPGGSLTEFSVAEFVSQEWASIHSIASFCCWPKVGLGGFSHSKRH
jgi:hypothetical protein